jgi:hypothetical protein
MVALALVSPMKVAQADSLALDENKVAGSRGSASQREFCSSCGIEPRMPTRTVGAGHALRSVSLAKY